MTLAEEIGKVNRISETDARDLATILIQSISITEDNFNLKHHDSILSELITFLEKCLNDEGLTKQDKLFIVKFLDKANLQKELVGLKQQGVSIDDLKIAAERLGKKSQSAFGGD